MLTVRTSENTVITSFRLISERQDFSSVRTGENTVRARARIQPEINLLIFNELEKERETLGCKELETKVGLLHEALSSIGAKSYQPKDPEATVPVPLKLILIKIGTLSARSWKTILNRQRIQRIR